MKNKYKSIIFALLPTLVLADLSEPQMVKLNSDMQTNPDVIGIP